MEVSEKLKRLLSKKKRKHSYYYPEEPGGNCNSKLDQQLAISCRQFFNRKIEFHCVESSDSHLEKLKSLHRPLNPQLPVSTMSKTPHKSTSNNDRGGGDNSGEDTSPMKDDIPKAKKDIFDSKNLVMEWMKARGIGAGLCNMGNTCFLNSILQCLVYTPPLYNFITSPEHKQKCRAQGFCAMCELQRHATRVFSTQSYVKPVPIVQNLKAIAKQFRQGRQEDAHEFLRYFVDGLQKSSIQGLPPKLDPHTKATTVVHKIFGGYHRSQVKCLVCMKTSDTFDPLLEINLDIKNCSSLTDALKKSILVDTLDGENSYACPFCKKMTRAQKRYTIHRLPNVLTIQLKRFEYNGMFGGKINKAISFAEFINMRPYMSSPKGPSEWYRLYGVLVHLGYSSHSGHYYCYIKNSNKVWYCMNDTQVTQVGLSTVLSQEAYLLFYIRDESHRPPEVTPTSKNSMSHAPPRTPDNSGNTSKVQMNPMNLGAAMNRPTPPRASLDKTGTPLVKLNPKPTGIVNPKPTGIVNPKPTGIVNPSPHTPTNLSSPATNVVKTPPQAPPLLLLTPPSAKKKNGKENGTGNSIEGVRNFSIPLRKTPIVSLSNDVTKKEDSPPVVSPPRVEVVKQKEERKPLSTPLFTPRQIVAPPKIKKIAKAKKSCDQPQQQKRVVIEETTRQIPLVKSIPAQNLEEDKNPAISDAPKEEMTDIKLKPNQPCFVALSEKTTPKSPPMSLTDREGGHIEATPSNAPQQLTNIPRVTPFSLKQKIAMVLPLPQTGTGTKPVARVKPILHLSPSGTTTKDENRTRETGGLPSSHSRHRSREVLSPPARDHNRSSGHRHSRKKHKKSHRRHTDHVTDSLVERRRDAGWKWREKDARKKSHHSHRLESPLDRTLSTSSDSESEYSQQRHRDQSSHRYHKHRSHRTPPPSHLSSEERRKKRKRLHSDGRRGNEHSSSTSVDVYKHKKSKLNSDHLASIQETKKLSPVPEIEWDSGGAGTVGGLWDGAKRNDTVDQLISHSSDQLGAQVRTWAGEENTIDTSVMDAHKKGVVRDGWDKEMDKGKVKKVKKTTKDDFSSRKNPFQSFQSERNKFA